MSKIEVDTIDNVTGSTTLQVGDSNTSTINIGASGDTINIPSGATFNVNGTLGTFSGQNYPAFFAQGDTQQSITQATNTVVTYNQEVYDTDNCYASNVFTPNVAGKYFCYASVPFESNFNADQLLILSKNQTIGNSVNTMIYYTKETYSLNVYGSFDMNGTTDNIRVYIFHQNPSSANLNFGGNRQYAHFGAYRIGA